MIDEKADSNQIRNRIIWTFVLALILMLTFGFIMLALSFRAHETLEDAIGLQNGTISSSDLSRVMNDTHAIARGTFLFLSVGILLFSWLMFNLMFAIIPALRRIMHAIREVTKGDFSYRVDLPVDNEFGDIAKAFNLALDKVVASEKSLAKEKAGVEHLVDVRTKELQNEKARFLASINSMPLGFILLDRHGSVLMLNPAIKNMLELKDISDFEIAKDIESGKSVIEKLIKVAQRTASIKKIESLEIDTDKGRNLRTLMSPVISGGLTTGVVVLVEDITESKIMERSKDEFFSIASHELRTPLTAIRGNTSMIKEFYQKQLKERGLGLMVDDIYDSSVHLIEIVNDFLDVSRLEQGKMKFELQDFDIEKVINDVVYEMGSIAKEKKIDIKTEYASGGHVLVYADSNRIRQVIYNLIGNAVKFVETGGVTVKVEAVDGKVKVLVSDTGRGISPEGQQILFHKFQQAGESLLTRDTSKGTGLGLYISKLIIESLGGEVKLESSEEGKGSTFSFTLPQAKGHQKTSNHHSETKPDHGEEPFK